MTQEEGAIRARHFSVSHPTAVDFCDYDQEDWPCDAKRLLRLLDAERAEVYRLERRMQPRPAAGVTADGTQGMRRGAL